jgi:hypothetical protein
MASRRISVPVVFGGLANSVDQYKLPPGVAYNGKNFSVDRGVLAGGPRRQAEWSRSGAHANDKSGGLFYAEYAETKEFIAIIKPNGSSNATAYKINADTGVFTAITGATALPWGATDSENVWTFAQYEDFIYAGSPAGGWWMRRVGGPFGTVGVDPKYRADDEWRPFYPEYVSGDGLVGATLNRPPYPQRKFTGSDTVASTAGAGSYHYFTSTPVRANGSLQIGDLTFSDNTLSFFSIILPSVEDLTGVDFAFLRLRATDFDPDDWIVLNSLRAAFISDIATSLSSSWAGTLSYINGESERPAFDEYVFRFDLASMTNAQKAAFRRIVVRLEDFTWRPFTAELSFYKGGAKLWDVTGAVQDIEYAYAYYNPTNQTYTNATSEVFPKELVEGEPFLGYGAKGGAWVDLGAPDDATLAGNGYTKVHFFRKSTSGVSAIGTPTGTGTNGNTGTGTGGTGTGGGGTGTGPTENSGWKKIAEVDNTGDPAYIDKNRESYVRTLPTTELSFEPYSAGLDPETITVWRQHLVLAQDRKLFFSFSGRPRRFVPAPDFEFTLPDSNPNTMARTLYLTPGKVAKVVSMVGAGDSFFAASEEQAFYMVGDTAANATPPRPFPGNRGAIGYRATARMGRGVLVACRDGLWYSETLRAATDQSNDIVQSDELTKGCRKTWKDFLNAGTANVSVAVHNDEIWVSNGIKYLRLSRSLYDDQRHWEYGEQAVAISHLLSTVKYGLKMISTTGKVSTLLDNTASYSIAEADSSDTIFFWESGYTTTERRQLIGVYCIAEGAPTITVMMDTGDTGIKTQAFLPVSGVTQKSISLKPGFAFAVKVGGITATDVVRELVLIFDTVDPGYGS